MTRPLPARILEAQDRMNARLVSCMTHARFEAHYREILLTIPTFGELAGLTDNLQPGRPQPDR